MYTFTQRWFCPAQFCRRQVSLIANQLIFLQIDFAKIVKITKVLTQGRSDYDQWVTSYWISYSLNNGFYKAYSEGSAIVSIKTKSDRNGAISVLTGQTSYTRMILNILKYFLNFLGA